MILVSVVPKSEAKSGTGAGKWQCGGVLATDRVRAGLAAAGVTGGAGAAGDPELLTAVGQEHGSGGAGGGASADGCGEFDAGIGRGQAGVSTRDTLAWIPTRSS
jgi:hypothetical protein